jgi:hypothetical protein
MELKTGGPEWLGNKASMTQQVEKEVGGGIVEVGRFYLLVLTCS